jgi:protein-tyrosine kinase
MKIERTPKPARELSLLERAAEMYGFDGLLGPDREVDKPAPATPRHPDPFASSEVEKREPQAEAQRVSTGAQRQPVLSDSRRQAVEGLDTDEEGIAEAVDADALPFLRSEPEDADTLDEEPLDLANLPEWTPPPGIALIDRAMLAQKGMLVPGAPVGALAEEFRLVKRQLLLTAREVADTPLGQRARTFLVGSGKPGDGKTFCAINLAISLAAERDVEILLIDSDFAKPDVMKTLGLQEGFGFLDVLADHAIDPESCVVRTDVPQLVLMPAGARTNADTELLASARTGEVIDRLLAANPKRIIVFDTPPVLAASPASVLALLVGQVMLVVRADRTTEADVRQAVGLLDGCDSISLVLNAVSYQPGGGRFGSYYGQEKS